LTTRKSDGEATIFLRVRRRKTDERKELDILVNTLLHCDDAKKWRKNYDVEGKSDKFRRANKALFDKLDAIRDAVDDLIDTGVYDKASIDKVVADIAYKEIREQQEREKQKQEQARIQKKQEQQAARLNVVNFYNEFLEGITNGDIKHGKDATYSKGSLQVWRGFGVYLTDFCKGKHITFDTIDLRTANKWTKYLDKDRGLMPKTVVKYVICFRALCNYASKIGVNRNAVSLKCWSERQVKDTEMRAATYLNEEELQALYDMPLTGEKERTRDMFVLGTLLCQRYSDYMNLYKDNFAQPLDDGTPCCRLTQQKTGTSVVIPFYDDRIVTKCKKYDYDLPHIKDIPLQSFNRYLKIIMQELSDSVPSLNDTFVTMLTAAERRSEQRYRDEHNGADLYQRNARGQVLKYKWDIITGHSARRSGITCLYNKHVLTNREIMRISGHSTEAIFERYIRTGRDEIAMNINKKLRM
jgi:integrase